MNVQKGMSTMTVCERLIQYAAVNTQSDAGSATCPSTPGQRELGVLLAAEMKELGLSNVKQDENGYVYARLPATPGMEGEPVIGLIAHLDTSPSLSGAKVHPRVVRYEGGALSLDPEGRYQLTPQEFPHLESYLGQELVVTDGATLLGADDKAGIAEILSAAEYLLAHPEVSHGEIAIAFTPDEEIGRGADRFDVAGFGAQYAYTVDGGILGELQYENFNAASAIVTICGKNIHPGDAKDKMKNSLLLAMQFQSLLPPCEAPAHTAGYEGFYHLDTMAGDVEKTVMEYLIRDHNRDQFEAKKQNMERIAHFMNGQYGAGTVCLQLTDTYYNMREQLENRMDILVRAQRAFEAVGVSPIIQPVRGGTDGSRLSYMGLPCPNLSTGGHNFHGRFEYIPVKSMEKMVEMLVDLVKTEKITD